MLKRSLLLVIFLAFSNRVSAVALFGQDYSLTLIVPVLMILFALLFFLGIYLKDNWKRFKLPVHRKHRKHEVKVETDFSSEFSNLKKSLKKQSDGQALDSIEDLTKKFLGEKLKIIGEFSFEELPKERLSLSTRSFIEKISELKYSGEAVTRQKIANLLFQLSGLLRVRFAGDEAPHKKRFRFRIPKISLNLFPKKKYAPKSLKVPRPNKLNLSPPKPSSNLGAVERLNRRLMGLMRKIELSLSRPKKALKLYQKAVELNRVIPRSGLTIKLKELNSRILTYKEKEDKTKLKKARSKKNKNLEKTSQAIQQLVKQTEANIIDYRKALKLHEKAVKLNKTVPHHEFSGKLSALYQSIVRTKERQNEIKLRNIDLQNQKKIKQVRDSKTSEVRRVMKIAENNISNVSKALKIHSKALKLNQGIPNSHLQKELKDLHDKILCERQKQIRDAKKRELEKINGEISELIQMSESSIKNTKKALKFYERALGIYTSLPERQGFTARLKELHEKILENKIRPIASPLENKKIELPEKEYQAKKKHSSANPNKIIRLLKKAERMSSRNPLLSKKFHDRALFMYYELPIQDEKQITSRLSGFYEKIQGPKHLVEYKKNDLHKTREALKEYQKYKNYVILEESKDRNEISRHLQDIKKHALAHLSKEKNPSMKRSINSLLRNINKKHEKIINLDTREIENLHKSSQNLLNEISSKSRRVSSPVSEDEHSINDSAKSLFEKLGIKHHSPHIPRQITDIPKPRTPEPISTSGEAAGEPEVFGEELIKPKIILKAAKIHIRPPELHERKIPESIKRLQKEKEMLNEKLRSLEYQDDILGKIRNQ